MSEIPKIKLEGSSEHKTKGDEQGAVVIPKIRPGESERGGGKVRLKRINIKWAKKLFKSKKFKIAGLVIAVVLVVLAFLSFQFFRIYKKSLAVKSSVESLVGAAKSQNLEEIKVELENTKTAVDRLHSTFRIVYWMRHAPLVGKYVDDADHGINAAKHGISLGETVIEIIEPYADIIGFSADKGDEASSGQETTQDRLDFIIATIPEVIPRADEVIEKVTEVRDEIKHINPDHYPEEFAGRKIREKIKQGVEMVDLGAELIENSKPLLEVSPSILGVDSEKIYLVIFQNDKELRPTGGFITAYSIAKVNKGKFEPVTSSDIYNLDNKYTPSIPASDPIVEYIKGPYLIDKNYRLRDMNWSPDFYESMKLFSEEIKSAGIDEIDGIIAVDTQLLVNILDVLGVVEVPGYGGYSTDIVEVCDCPQVVYELESFADLEGPIVWSENEPGKIVFAPPNYDNRKKIIGPMMNSILANAMGLTSDKVPALFEAIFKSVIEKHVLLYMFDDDVQRAVEVFGIAGRLDEYDGDYLLVNDANLGGRKSNLYVTQEVSQDIVVTRDGTVEKTLTITYKNPMRHDGWLNSVLPNYVRVYVPEGSELIDFQGVSEKEDPYTELGKTVFAGFFELRPLGVAKITIQYKLPFKADADYKLLIQKQPGADKPLHSIKIGKKEEEFYLRTDKELKFSL